MALAQSSFAIKLMPISSNVKGRGFSTFSSSQFYTTVQSRLTAAEEAVASLGLPSPGTLGAQQATVAGLS